MTGYGKAEGLINGLHLTVELRSLNGKNFDLGRRFPTALKPMETEIRTLLMDLLSRGSIDLNFTAVAQQDQSPVQINETLLEAYHQQLSAIAKRLSLPLNEGQYLPTLLTLPQVMTTASEELTALEWQDLKPLVQEAANQLKAFRAQEGAGLEKDLWSRISQIEQLLTQIAPFEAQRIERIKERLQKHLEEWRGQDQVDPNRFEQELIYYLEKIDFSEEKQRLQAHCNYFKELCAKGTNEGMGKKLGFVLQEIGREINTLGSKANDSDIQKIVINMKDELEKAKEQILNVL